MSTTSEIQNMAVFCDFENVALGVNEAGYAAFDIHKVLDRLLLKGSIVVKKAYCDWERYKEFKRAMHEAAFELIEIPHRSQSGKNSADIRMVVDALDLCYTKTHIDGFVIISGDSDFSPLVSKLRENNKRVIGIGVRKSTSPLLMSNCHEFIFYDDLVKQELKKEQVKAQQQKKDSAPAAAKPATAPKKKAATKTPSPPKTASKAAAAPALEPAEDAQRLEGIRLVVETVEALVAEHGSDDKLWAGTVKNAVKRRRPDFNESTYGFSTFGKLLEDAKKRGLLAPSRDEKTNNYLVKLPAREE